MECKHLTRILEQQNALIASLNARLDALEHNQSTAGEKRKKPNPPAQTPELPNWTPQKQTQPPSPPPQIEEMFTNLAKQLASINQDLQNIRQENQKLQQDIQSLRTEYHTFRQEAISVNTSPTSLDHSNDLGPIRQDRASKGSLRNHTRAVPYARNTDNTISASLPDEPEAT